MSSMPMGMSVSMCLCVKIVSTGHTFSDIQKCKKMTFVDVTFAIEQSLQKIVLHDRDLFSKVNNFKC